MLALLVTAALAGTPPPNAQPAWPVTLGVDLAMVAGPGATGGVATFRAVVNLRALSLELYGGEGYLAGVQRQTGRLGFGLRRYIWRGSYVRGGLTHSHEVPWAAFREHVGGSLAGTHGSVLHRSGVELGVGWVVALGREGLRERFQLAVDVAGAVLPGDARPFGYGQVGVGVVAHVGRPRPDPEQHRRPR